MRSYDTRALLLSTITDHVTKPNTKILILTCGVVALATASASDSGILMSATVAPAATFPDSLYVNGFSLMYGRMESMAEGEKAGSVQSESGEGKRAPTAGDSDGGALAPLGRFKRELTSGVDSVGRDDDPSERVELIAEEGGDETRRSNYRVAVFPACSSKVTECISERVVVVSLFCVVLCVVLCCVFLFFPHPFLPFLSFFLPSVEERGATHSVNVEQRNNNNSKKKKTETKRNDSGIEPSEGAVFEGSSPIGNELFTGFLSCFRLSKTHLK